MPPDPFDILNLPPRFDLDQAEVERAYLARSAALHPDLAANDPEAARAMADLNHARRVLSDPEQRADALLRRLGGPTREQERGLPHGFLAQIMEIRQEIESALAEDDPRRCAAERARWQNWARQQRAQAIADVGAMFAALETPPTQDALRAIRVHLNAWRYIERLIEQLSL